MTVLALVLLLGLMQPQRLAAEVDAPSVQRAIDRGIAYLRKSQTERGGWSEYGSQSCGLSSLCTLALLNAGVSRDDPDMVRALRYLRSFEPEETYSVSLQTLVYCQLGAAGDLPRIRRNVQWLIDTQKRESAGSAQVGGWSYGRRIGSGDPSNSQFALLALGAAKERGLEVDPQVFQRSLDYWKIRQRRDGGWGYGSSQPATGSMTSAGIASMIIARGGLTGTSSQVDGDRVRCCGTATDAEDPVEKGMEWLAKRFSTSVNPGGDKMTYYYYMYAVERVGRLSGRRFIGGHDWYREGAEQLLAENDQFQGFWAGAAPMENNRDIATSFALLFLSKGKRQVVISELQYPSSDGDQQWRSHPDGLMQLVRHVERAWGRDLSWQTIAGQTGAGQTGAGQTNGQLGGTVATVEDLLQSPVLVIRGRSALRFSDQLAKNLQEYTEQGGTILFEADQGDGCGDASAFEKSVRDLCAKWYEGASLERLPPSHPVWFAERDVAPNSIPLIDKDFWVYGVQACCRTAVFYVPNSLSCRWELSELLVGRNELPAPVHDQIDLAVRLGENIIAYATGRELQDKLQQRTILDGGEAPEPTRGAIQIAMLSLDAGGAEARRAIPNAAELIRQRIAIEIIAAKDPVGLSAERLRTVPILWIHGRTEFQWNASERAILAEYLQNDGILFATAICGSEAFSESFRREMQLILPDSPLEKLTASHPSLTSMYGGFDIRSVEIRRPIGAETGQNAGSQRGTPVLEVATVRDLASVFFSPLDVSCALESQNSVQCPGYPTEDAAKIVANMILFGLNQ